MTSFKLFGAALILSTASAMPVFAQVPEPGDYAFSQEPAFPRFIARLRAR